jgi:protein-tyrosine phosphatase
MFYMIDFHSHILPGIDDGSKNTETSIAMLKTARAQGVQVQIATPHFYAHRDRVEAFLERRARAYEQVMGSYSEEMPRILLGAEVAYFDGISRAEEIRKLTIEESNLLLLEMPFETWTEHVIKEVRTLIYERGFKVIIAHIERYLRFQGNKKMIEELLKLPVIIQINAEPLTDWRQRRAILKMFKAGKAHLLGSDCHGMRHRPPNLSAGRAVIQRKLGIEYLDQIDRFGNDLISCIL